MKTTRPRHPDLHRRALRSVALAAATALAGLASPPALAQAPAAAAEARRIELPAQALETALPALAQQLGVPVAADAALLRGRQAPAVSGSFTAAQALERVLAGSGLVAAREGPTFVVRMMPSTAASPATLPEVRVRSTGQQAGSGRGAAQELTSPAIDLGVLGDRAMVDTPFTAQSYTRQLIEAQQAQDVAAVASNHAAVQRSWDAGTWNTGVAIRGFTTGVSMLDGNLLPTYDGNYPVELIERVEVLAGPSSLLFGGGNNVFSGSSGGVVNLVPKRPPVAGTIRAVRASVETGGGVRASADLGFRLGEQSEFGLRFIAGGKRGETAVAEYRQDLSFIAVSGDWRAAPGVLIGADAGITQQRYRRYVDIVGLPAGFIPPVPDLARSNPSHAWNAYQDDVRYALLRVEARLSDAWRLESQVALGRAPNSYDGAGGPSTPLNPEGDTLQSASWYRGDVSSRSLRVALKGRLEAAGLRHDLVLSARADRFKLSNAAGGGYDLSAFGGTLPNNLYNPVVYAEPARQVDYAYDDEFRARTLQVTDFISLGAHWTALIGVGHVRLVKPANAFTLPYDDAATTPLVGLIFKPGIDTSIYASFAEGLEPGGTAPAGAVNANRALPPKRNRQFEIGVKHASGDFLWSAAAFRAERVLEYVNAGGLFVQDGRQVHDGVEVAGSGAVSERLRVIASAVLLRPRVDNEDPASDGKRPPGVQRVAARLFGQYVPAWWPGASVSAGLTHRSRQAANSDNSLSIPSWTTLDAGVAYDLSPLGLRGGVLRLNVDNVTDRRYYRSAVLGFGLTVGAPRTVTLSLGFEL